MTESSPRQVLYAAVAACFLVVVALLIVAGAVTGLVPAWWTATLGGSLVLLAVWSGYNWRRTGPVLLGSIGFFVIWAIGTLIVAT